MKAKKNKPTENKPKLLLYFKDIRLLGQIGINFSKHLLLIFVLPWCRSITITLWRSSAINKGSGNYNPYTKSPPLPIVSKILLEYSHAHLSICCLGCFYHVITEFSSWTETVIYKAKNINSLAFYRIKFASSYS